MHRFAVLFAIVAVAAAGCTSSALESTTTTLQDTPVTTAQDTTTTAIATTTTTTTTTTVDSPTLVFSVVQSGGCDWGFQCQVWRFYSDGRVEAFRRVGPDEDPEPPRMGEIDAALVGMVSKELVGLDLGELRASLPEGVLKALLDGVDLAYFYSVTDGQDGRFYSHETELLPTIPLFAATMEAIDAADEVIEPLNPGPDEDN